MNSVVPHIHVGALRAGSTREAILGIRYSRSLAGTEIKVVRLGLLEDSTMKDIPQIDLTELYLEEAQVKLGNEKGKHVHQDEKERFYIVRAQLNMARDGIVDFSLNSCVRFVLNGCMRNVQEDWNAYDCVKAAGDMVVPQSEENSEVRSQPYLAQGSHLKDHFLDIVVNHDVQSTKPMEGFSSKPHALASLVTSAPTCPAFYAQKDDQAQLLRLYYDIGVVLELDTANQKAESMFRSVLTAAEPSTMISTSQMRPTSNSFRYRINASGASSEPFLNPSFSGHAALLIDYAAFILPLLILMVFTPKWLKRQFRRQALPGYHRFEWQCDCGDALFGDYKAGTTNDLAPLGYQLSSINERRLVERPSGSSNHRDSVDITVTSLKDSTTFQASSASSKQVNPPEQVQKVIATPDSHFTVAYEEEAANPIGHRFLELCVNTSRLTICLAELNLNGSDYDAQKIVRTDAQLFRLIYENYHRVRKLRRLAFLYTPVDIQFVRFSVFDGGHVGIYEGPMSLPPESEVRKRNYHYYKCPLEPLPPIDHRTFFHYFWNHRRHQSSPSSIFISRMPKKLGRSMREQDMPDQLNLGWGVHIIEGPNKKLISLLLFLIVLLSFIISLVYSCATHADESGFGIGQWILASLTVGVSAVYFHVSE